MLTDNWKEGRVNAEGKLANTQRVLELANPYFASMMVKIGLGKSHQGMQVLACNLGRRHSICMVFYTAN